MWYTWVHQGRREKTLHRDADPRVHRIPGAVMSKPKPIAVDGAFSLFPPYGKYKAYRIEWYNKSSRQTEGLSTGTIDREAAEIIFKEYCLKHSKERLKDEPLLNSCNRYFLDYGNQLASRATFQLALASTIRVLANPDEGNFGPLVSEMGISNQKKLITAWREEKVADSTIVRWLGCLWAAMNHAAENEHLNPTIIPKRISAKRWSPHLVNRSRVLSPLEMATLLDATCLVPSRATPRFSLHSPKGKYTSYRVWWTDPQTSRTMRRSLQTSELEVATQRLEEFKTQYLEAHRVTFTEEYGMRFRALLSLIATGSRQQAIVELVMPTQIKFEHGVLDLNPVGRQQTSKFRPIIPMAQTYAQWLASWKPLTPQGHLLGVAGAPLVSTRALFKSLRQQTGIRCSAHVIRHTISTWLSSRLSAPWERDQFMGWQRSEGSAMGTVYSHYDPRYLRQCSDLIQQLLDVIAGHMVGDLLRRGRVDQPLPPSDELLAWINTGLSDGFPRLVGYLTPVRPPEDCVEERSATAQSGCSEDPNPAYGASDLDAAWQMRGAEGDFPTRGDDENPVKTSVGRLGLEPRTNTLKGCTVHHEKPTNQ